MRITSNQLNAHLKQHKDNLLPVYFVCGDEPLQLNEACDSIRKSARQSGYDERQIFHVSSSFDWDTLLAAANTLSLFSEKRLIELRIPNGKPGDKGSKALIKYINNLPVDTVLLIISGKIEPQSQKSKWFTHVEKTGLVCQIWPIDVAQMPAWIDQRLRAAGLTPTNDAVSLLSERVEGTLLAATQEIQKLFLMHGKKNIDANDVLDSVSDNSRFSVFALTDAALTADAARVTRILHALRSEGVEPILILWALSREIRELGTMSSEITKGATIESVLGKYHVWEKRKPQFRKSLQQHRALFWQNLLIRCGHIDKVIKGAETGNIWDELLQLSLLLTGIRLFSRSA